jgi:hypothetical protein
MAANLSGLFAQLNNVIGQMILYLLCRLRLV